VMLLLNYDAKRWRKLSAAAMRRDGYQCQLSKRYGKTVQAEVVHHIYPADEYPEYAYCLWNLISLSRKMHNALHDRENDSLTAEGVALMRRTKAQHPPTSEI
jgi:5-methylcytosine-specific restriction endonuclease McrA